MGRSKMNTSEHYIILSTEEQKIWQILETVCDPEVPVLSITDLGIVRDVKIIEDLPRFPIENLMVQITITPTYSGCPAMDAISMDIRLKMIEHGFKNVKIISVLSPAWTTDWMSENGKRKLNAYGIAPPRLVADGITSVNSLQCPQCHSTNTRLLSQFGSTACKALYQCNDCKEPFDYFKCH